MWRRVWGWGLWEGPEGEEAVLTFISLYRCLIEQCKTVDGEKGGFISFVVGIERCDLIEKHHTLSHRFQLRIFQTRFPHHGGLWTHTLLKPFVSTVEGR